MAVRLEVEVLDSAGAPLFQIQHDDVRYVVARPGPYTVRVRHFGPQKMDMEMCVDGKTAAKPGCAPVCAACWGWVCLR